MRGFFGRAATKAFAVTRLQHETKTHQFLPESIFGIDVDDLFAYRTNKKIIVRDARLGLLFYAFLAGIFLYVGVFEIIYKCRYLSLYAPSITVQLALTEPVEGDCNPQETICVNRLPSFTGAGYCCVAADCLWNDNFECFCRQNPGKTNFNCTYEDGDTASNIMQNSMLVSTFVHTYMMKRNATCSGEVFCTRLWPAIHERKEYVLGIEDFIIKLNPRVVQAELEISKVPNEMRGLMYVDGEGVHQNALCRDRPDAVSSPSLKADPTDEAPCYIRPTHKPGRQGDFFILRQLLQAVDVDLDDDTEFSRTVRQNGFTLLISVEYYNWEKWVGLLREEPERYIYKVSAKISPYEQTRELWTQFPTERAVEVRRGILIDVTPAGNFAAFSLIPFLVQLAASITLVKVAHLTVNSLARFCLRDKQFYNHAMFDTTYDFSDVSFLKALSPEERHALLVLRGLSTRGTDFEQVLRLLKSGWSLDNADFEDEDDDESGHMSDKTRPTLAPGRGRTSIFGNQLTSSQNMVPQQRASVASTASGASSFDRIKSVTMKPRASCMSVKSNFSEAHMTALQGLSESRSKVKRAVLSSSAFKDPVAETRRRNSAAKKPRQIDEESREEEFADLENRPPDKEQARTIGQSHENERQQPSGPASSSDAPAISPNDVHVRGGQEGIDEPTAKRHDFASPVAGCHNAQSSSASNSRMLLSASRKPPAQEFQSLKGSNATSQLQSPRMDTPAQELHSLKAASSTSHLQSPWVDKKWEKPLQSHQKDSAKQPQHDHESPNLSAQSSSSPHGTPKGSPHHSSRQAAHSPRVSPSGNDTHPVYGASIGNSQTEHHTQFATEFHGSQQSIDYSRAQNQTQFATNPMPSPSISPSQTRFLAPSAQPQMPSPDPSSSPRDWHHSASDCEIGSMDGQPPPVWQQSSLSQGPGNQQQISQQHMSSTTERMTSSKSVGERRERRRRRRCQNEQQEQQQLPAVLSQEQQQCQQAPQQQRQQPWQQAQQQQQQPMQQHHPPPSPLRQFPQQQRQQQEQQQQPLQQQQLQQPSPSPLWQFPQQERQQQGHQQQPRQLPPEQTLPTRQPQQLQLPLQPQLPLQQLPPSPQQRQPLLTLGQQQQQAPSTPWQAQEVQQPQQQQQPSSPWQQQQQPLPPWQQPQAPLQIQSAWSPQQQMSPEEPMFPWSPKVGNDDHRQVKAEATVATSVFMDQLKSAAAAAAMTPWSPSNAGSPQGWSSSAAWNLSPASPSRINRNHLNRPREID